MERIVLFYFFILFVVITSTLCKDIRIKPGGDKDELSCRNHEAIRITTVYRVEAAYCGKDTSTCSWRNTKIFPERCSIESLPQLIYNCNGNNNCSHLYSILNDTECCNLANGTLDCRNRRKYNLYFECLLDMEILDLDTDKERFISGKLSMIRASKKSDNLCKCSVRPEQSHSLLYYYCDKSIHSKDCTSRQSSSTQRNFSFYPNNFTSLLLEKTSSGGNVTVNCSCSSDDKRITSNPNPLTTSNVETQTTEKEKEKEKTDGSNTMVLIASAAGGGLLLIVTTVLVVCLCKKRQGSVKDSTATDSAVNNRQYFNNRNNDALDDDGYYNVLPQNINPNVPQEMDDTYHHIGYSQNRPVVNDVDDTYNHIGGLKEDTSNRQAARNDHNDVDDTYNHIGGLSTSNRQAARNDHHMEEQAMGGNSSNDEATYTAVVKNVSGKVTGQRRVINEDEDDKTYAEVNKKK